MDTWLFFALAAPLLWGLTNVVDVALRRGPLQSDLTLSWIVSGTRLVAAVFVFLFFPVSFDLDWEIILGMLMSGLLWSLPLLLYFKALEYEEASRVALLFQFHPVFVLLIAILFLGEQLTGMQGAAFFLMLCGGLAAALHLKEKQWRFSSVFLVIILADFFWALSDVVFKGYEVKFLNYASAVTLFFLGSSLLAFGLSCSAANRREIAKHLRGLSASTWGAVLLKSVVGMVAMASFTYALTLGSASLTTVIGTSQPLFVFAFGVLLAPFFPAIPKEDVRLSSVLLKAFSLLLLVCGIWLLG